ncbi:peptidase inhibitor family I36 protein [Falsarthrobacter nasiphocae]|uniref:Peptidase inhibitor family I36 n=1 Tax=Falsarthrobacter nasiphocae TaxID=189863 RepID=A0AAE3YG57_9MICC|nr:peptidase inhibitor family I36 protein [Falsarthrobacter nasiphocae]MDR6891560.1 hypothetical protein [Falsarthrobacter nasiphocae]
MSQFFRRLLAGAAVAAAATTTLAVPAEAALSDCPPGAVCFWNDANFSGSLNWRWGGQGLQNISWWNSDELSSYYNNSGYNAAFYDHSNGRGACWTMWSGQAVAYVGDWANDRASSWRMDRGC